ncbi:MAG: trypsin-like serine protease [bacterium]|nr:trypsin-like serine protease [bacterium]
MKKKGKKILITISASCILYTLSINSAFSNDKIIFSDGDSTSDTTSSEDFSMPFEGAMSNVSESNEKELYELLNEAGVNQEKPNYEVIKKLKPIRNKNISNTELHKEIIFGNWDTRTRQYTTEYPSRALVMLKINDGGLCSGTLVSPDTVITAGHCVHPSNSNPYDWYSVTAYPGYNLNALWGSCEAVGLSTYYKWYKYRKEGYDIAAINLNCTIGDVTGWLGVTTQNPLKTPTRIIGYPGDKQIGTQWGATDRIRARTFRQLFYQNDTAGGMSGSGIWADFETATMSGPYIFGVHGYGFPHKNKLHRKYNHGIRINNPVFNTISYWIDEW